MGKLMQNVSFVNDYFVNAVIHLRSVAYAEFFNGGVSVTSHCDDVKILHYNYSSLEVLKCIVL